MKNIMFLAVLTAMSPLAQVHALSPECKEVREKIFDLCGTASPNDCLVNSDERFKQVMQIVKSIPSLNIEMKMKEIKTLLDQPPTKERVAELMGKWGGSCESRKIFQLLTRAGKYADEKKNPQANKELNSVAHEWLTKEQNDIYSLEKRMDLALELGQWKIMKWTDSSLKDLKQMKKNFKDEIEPLVVANNPELISQDEVRLAKAWNKKMKKELELQQKYSRQWLKWLEANWKPLS